jgi:dissimilatory sulfite reductase (desulfoviridin) alpha/beta subunit
MQWTPEAEEALNKVPFFVRPRARARVEHEAAQAGKTQVTLADVRTARQRLISGMAAEVKGYQVELCFGPGGCPNTIMAATPLSERIEKVLREADLLGTLKSKGVRELKHHHEFRVAIAECPNACSQVQIKDVGIIAALRPQVGGEPCSGCEGCVSACREGAVGLDPTPRPVIDPNRCVACGQCLPACPTGTLVPGVKGWRIQLGGKLGRHPQLARELPGIYDEANAIQIVRACLELYKTRARGGDRFGAVLTADAFQSLAARFTPLT